MQEALVLARESLARRDAAIGAVIVHDGEIVARGCNAVDSQCNDSLHAEFAAIQSIPAFLYAHKRRCTIYTTLEPCAMCLGAIVYSGIDRIVYGASDPLCATHPTLAATPYYAQKRLVIVPGVLERDCQLALNEYVALRPNRPYLFKPLAAGGGL